MEQNLVSGSLDPHFAGSASLTAQRTVKNPFKVASVSTNKKAYRAGNKLVLSMKVTGAKPQSCSVYFDSGNGWSTGIDYNEKTGLYEFRWKVTNSTDVGKYKIDRIELTDKKGNRFSFYNTQLHKGSGKAYVDMSKAGFQVKKKTVKNPFKVASVSTNKKAYRAGNKLVLSMKVTGAKPQSCSVYFDSGNGWSTGIDYNEKTGLYEFRWKVTNSTDVGKYKIDRIELTDKKGNRFSFYNTQLHKGSGKAYVDMSKAAFTVK